MFVFEDGARRRCTSSACINKHLKEKKKKKLKCVIAVECFFFFFRAQIRLYSKVFCKYGGFMTALAEQCIYCPIKIKNNGSIVSPRIIKLMDTAV